MRGEKAANLLKARSTQNPSSFCLRSVLQALSPCRPNQSSALIDGLPWVVPTPKLVSQSNPHLVMILVFPRFN